MNLPPVLFSRVSDFAVTNADPECRKRQVTTIQVVKLAFRMYHWNGSLILLVIFSANNSPSPWCRISMLLLTKWFWWAVSNMDVWYRVDDLSIHSTKTRIWLAELDQITIPDCVALCGERREKLRQLFLSHHRLYVWDLVSIFIRIGPSVWRGSKLDYVL